MRIHAHACACMRMHAHAYVCVLVLMHSSTRSRMGVHVHAATSSQTACHIHTHAFPCTHVHSHAHTCLRMRPRPRALLAEGLQQPLDCLPRRTDQGADDLAASAGALGEGPGEGFLDGKVARRLQPDHDALAGTQGLAGLPLDLGHLEG